MLATARGWKHARVDPHVNCFIPRRLHSTPLDEYGKERSYNRGEARWKLESLLVYDRDMTAAPRLYITSRHSGPTLLTPADQCARSGDVRFHREGHLTDQVKLNDLLSPSCRVLNQKAARWIFDVRGKLPDDIFAR